MQNGGSAEELIYRLETNICKMGVVGLGISVAVMAVIFCFGTPSNISKKNFEETTCNMGVVGLGIAVDVRLKLIFRVSRRPVT